MPASGSTVRGPVTGPAAGGAAGPSLGGPGGAGQAGASGGRRAVGADALLLNGLVSAVSTTVRMMASPIASTAPATPAKISICRRRRGPPSPGGSGGAGGGGGFSGGRPAEVTVP